MFKPQQTPVYDDIDVGYELPQSQLTLTPTMIVRWIAATEIWRRDHHDRDYALDKALPDIIGSASWSRALLYAMVSNWVGHDGWVFKISQQNRAYLVPGDGLTVWARVEKKYVKNDLGYLELDLGLRNQENVDAVRAQATVVLSLRGGPAVPYPFNPVE
jgi:acyl dehydratase